MPRSKTKSKSKKAATKSKGKKRALSPDAPAPAAKKRKVTIPVDPEVPGAGGFAVVDDFDAMLNQTNIGANNNKFYRIQVLQKGNNFYAWNRWGRVGESGQSAMKGPFSREDAIKDFKKKFSDKTKNKWDERENFEPKAKKYTLLEMEYDEEESKNDSDDEEEDFDVQDTGSKSKSKSKAKSKKAVKSELPQRLQDFLALIFDEDMFADQMKELKLDTKKMPLGKISKSQIDKGFAALEELEKVVKGKGAGKKKENKINELSSRFYTLIPHDFGRTKPTALDTTAAVQEKMDMLEVLQDIESAQDVIGKPKGSEDDEMHPLDLKYSKLGAELEPLKKTGKTYKLLTTYFNNTKSGGWWNSNAKILDIFSVLQPDQLKKYKSSKCNKLDNKKLLWHGTNVAVVVAILKSGLRIMPHSGGRVGKGIYFASEAGKSLGYCSSAGNGEFVMFLTEAALGNNHDIVRDDSSLTKPPKGYDSVIAQGQHDPDPKQNEILKIGDSDVIVPKGKPKQRAEYQNSNFDFSEYLIYNESQNKIRFALRMQR